MTWDQAGGDVDLHLAQNGTGWCGGSDCYYANCLGNGRPWGSTLEIDDTCGFGPENINIENVADGTYTVAATYYGSAFGVGCSSQTAPPTNVTVRVFVAGSLEFEAEHFMSRGDNWLPVRVERRNGVSSIVELDDTRDQNATCFGL